MAKGGDRLAEALRGISDRASSATKVQIGFLEGASYPDGTSVALVAAVQEFGSPANGIPPRPYFRQMIDKNKGEWPKMIGDLLRANEFDGRKTLEMTGAEVSGELRESIIDTLSPPLSPVTLMLRKMKADNPDLNVTRATVVEARAKVAKGDDYSGVSTKPLVDTGHLLQSVDFVVK